ncbi:MAG: OmpA family protein [Proteobacteria bacterium]|nr:OmpA family protein [Pseudomonadota bacterium]
MNTLAAMYQVPVRRFFLAVIVTTLPWAFAEAQSVDLSTNNVDVDLSVIDQAGSVPSPGLTYGTPPGFSTPRSGLLLPGATPPRSRLHVAAPEETGRIKLRPPGTKSKKPAKRVARKKVRTAKPKPPMPAKPALPASKPPAPLTASAPPAPPVPKEPAKPAKAPEKAKMVAKKTPEKTAKATPPVAPPAPPKAAPSPPPAAAPAKDKTVSVSVPKPAPAKKQQASLPSAKDTLKKGRALQVVFGTKVSKLPDNAKPDLLGLAKKLKGKDNLRLQLLAYAGGKDLSSSKARRMSLSRALSVRSFLIESGVRSTRIDVRALGSKTTEDPVNRVDVNIAER